MLIKDQIKLRMESLGITQQELAERCGVTQQSVQYWISGRSNPQKKRTRQLESVLQFKLDFSEGELSERQTVTEMMSAHEPELFSKIQRMTPEAKIILEKLVDQLLDKQTERVAPFFEKVTYELVPTKVEQQT